MQHDLTNIRKHILKESYKYHIIEDVFVWTDEGKTVKSMKSDVLLINESGKVRQIPNDIFKSAYETLGDLCIRKAPVWVKVVDKEMTYQLAEKVLTVKPGEYLVLECSEGEAFLQQTVMWKMSHSEYQLLLDPVG